ncbi:hypothetical protein TSUD_65460 [Trifolium subterraneum]|uniref:Uncharacterized protein n=1 Tax=Trifolium subterraneum TaxID=3900 RepID=A0A2Z6MCT8_TRISU|nr:hypothetical protein TSUD_65460 [Trifolium subterraneum]
MEENDQRSRMEENECCSIWGLETEQRCKFVGDLLAVEFDATTIRSLFVSDSRAVGIDGHPFKRT